MTSLVDPLSEEKKGGSLSKAMGELNSQPLLIHTFLNQGKAKLKYLLSLPSTKINNLLVDKRKRRLTNY